MAEEKNIIELGSVSFTDCGDWQSGYSFTDEDSGEKITGYDEGDIVHTQKGAYCSMRDGNTTDPDADTSHQAWRVWLDLAPINTAATNEAARTKAEAARASAETARTQAEASRKDAETLRAQTEDNRSTHEQERETAETSRKASERQRALDFQALYDGLELKSKELDRLIAAIQQQDSVSPMASIPATIAVLAETTALTGMTINIAPTDVQPSTANRSMVYQIYSGNALVDAQGYVKTLEAGDVVVKVIPTLASGVARLVTIHVRDAEPLADEEGNNIADENDSEILC